MSENRKGYNNFRRIAACRNTGKKVSCAATNAIDVERRSLFTNPVATDRQTFADAGVRYSSVWFDSNDHYVTRVTATTAVMPVITNGYQPDRKICNDRCLECLSGSRARF